MIGEKEPFWWGRGATNCLAIIMNANGPYHHIFIGNGKTGEAGPRIPLMDDELDSLIQFLQDARFGKLETGR